MDIREKMHSGDLYLSMDEDLFNEQLTYLDKLYDFNATRPSELPKRTEMLKNMFAEIGEDCYIEPPLHANWAGKHVHFGKGVYANFNLTLVDDTHIYVGDYTMLGPNVVLFPLNVCSDILSAISSILSTENFAFDKMSFKASVGILPNLL